MVKRVPKPYATSAHAQPEQKVITKSSFAAERQIQRRSWRQQIVSAAKRSLRTHPQRLRLPPSRPPEEAVMQHTDCTRHISKRAPFRALPAGFACWYQRKQQ